MGERKKPGAEFKYSASARNGSVLSFGYGMPELRQKHAALSKLGFKVLSHSDFRSVRAVVDSESNKFGFLLIGPSVPDHERRILSNLYCARNPRGNVIFLYLGSITNGECATALLNERGSPDNLPNTINALSQDHRGTSDKAISDIGDLEQ
jgi:hypothetical protein